MISSMLWSALSPLVTLLIPGVFLVSSQEAPAARLARVGLWSFATWTLVTFVVAFLHLPLLYAVVIMGAVAVAAAWRQGFSWQPVIVKAKVWGPICFFSTIAYVFFGGAFLINHDALPTGDSQKAIFWGHRSATASRLPDYQQSINLLNRDPVDFYTPGLHTLTGVLVSLPGNSLSSIGWLAIAASIVVAIIAMAMVYELTPRTRQPWLPYLVGYVVLTNPRFLRYLREPGYHLQNVIGELFLFGLLFLGLSLLRRWHWSDVLLATMVGIALLISHQFSAFLAAFILAPTGALLGWHYGKKKLRPHLSLVKILGVLIIAGLCLAAGYVLGLHQKIPHLFTTLPHLRPLVLPLSTYPRLLGFTWLYGGLLGWLIMTRAGRRRPSTWGFTGALLICFALSYGPWWGVDIPPVRALFYSIVPLGVAMGAGIAALGKLPFRNRLLSATTVTAVLLSGGYACAQALAVNNTVRTNATLTAGQGALAQELMNVAPPGGVLVDDYNRRSSSWLLLGGRPTYTRLAADIKTQMAEAKQSSTRNQLYFNHLDYEKIFAMGSFPEVMLLLEKHGIDFVTGIRGSSEDAFAHNPALRAHRRADDITLFTRIPRGPSSLPPDVALWLLRPSTLVNDIGDSEDTFEHLPASLRSTRLGTPEAAGGQTWRTTTAPRFTLRFNVRDYTRVLWSKNALLIPDTSLEFYSQLSRPLPNLTLVTAAGERVALRSHAMIRLAAASVPFDEDGFITLVIENPTELPVAIDLIALGLARIP